MKAVCGREPVLSQRDTHLHALARSIATAVLNSVPELGSSAVTVTEVSVSPISYTVHWL